MTSTRSVPNVVRPQGPDAGGREPLDPLARDAAGLAAALGARFAELGNPAATREAEALARASQRAAVTALPAGCLDAQRPCVAGGDAVAVPAGARAVAGARRRPARSAAATAKRIENRRRWLTAW